MGNIKTYKLGDIVNVLDYKRIPLSSTQRQNKKGIYPYYGAQGIIDYIDDYIFDGEYLLIAEDGENLKSQKQHVAQIATGKYWVNNHAHIVESNGLCDIRYVCYLLNRMDLSGYITGSAQPKLNQANLLKIEIKLPSLKEQYKIAEFLHLFDGKIELNRRINENLEQQAQTLFKSWFVDFNPFKDGKFIDSELGMIPEGWKVGTLSDIANVTMGQSPKGISYNENGEGIVFYQGRADFGNRYPSIRLFTTEPTRYADPFSVLLSVRAPVGDINIAVEKCCIGRGLASIYSKTGHQSFVLYTMFSLKKELDKFNSEGTVFGSINRSSIENLKIVIPPINVMDKFEHLVSKIDDMLLNLFQETTRLAQLRDILLPRFMSGELIITDIVDKNLSE